MHQLKHGENEDEDNSLNILSDNNQFYEEIIIYLHM